MDGLLEITVIFTGFFRISTEACKGSEGSGSFSSSILWQVSLQTDASQRRKGEWFKRISSFARFACFCSINSPLNNPCKSEKSVVRTPLWRVGSNCGYRWFRLHFLLMILPSMILPLFFLIPNEQDPSLSPAPTRYPAEHSKPRSWNQNNSIGRIVYGKIINKKLNLNHR